jgi:hypothetical protein
MGERLDSKKWTLPGGKADEGEQPEACARRELWEEAGLKVSRLEFLGKGSGGKNGDWDIYCYKATCDDKPTAENDPDKECDEWEWIDVRTGFPDELKDCLHNGKNDVTLQLLGLQEGSANMGAELSKSWKHAFVGAIAAAGVAGSAAGQEPDSRWTPAGLHEELHPIAQLESSFGKRMNHAPNSKGDFHTAVGAVGLKPVTAHEEYERSPWVQKVFPNLHDPTKFTEEFKNNHALYNHVATSHWQHLKKLFGGDRQKAAYAWRWGQGAALRDSPEVQAGDPYAIAYQKLYDKSHAQVVATHLVNPLGKAEIEEWLGKAPVKREWRSKDGITIPAAGTPERAAYDQRFEQGVHQVFGSGVGKTLKPLQIDLSQVSNSYGNLPVVKDRLNLYTRMARGGDKLPPVVVRRAGSVYNMVDGNHRAAAAKAAGLPKLDAFEILDEKPKMTSGLPKGMKLYHLGDDPQGLMEPKVRQTKHGQFFEPVEMPDVEKKLKRMGYHGYHGHARDPNSYVAFAKAPKLPSVESATKRKG